ncbi:nicotinate phosphoribosyltransferase [Prauserella flavalba]|uniref:Nicotinate phosphoribosyltransferase n=1 Tax=Prauserella flavalba TaxID=1477506 RepID=A0A318LPS2_9PSEU|nr:nicotinate phosphoribosyltransferase [Prauserella flavalba]PXY36523.1 nicotinate phosphoribosyltransferase [Prauserella flavalba]
MTALHTDLYEIRMAVSYLRRSLTGQATFSLFARRLPPDRGCLVAAGLADSLAFLERFRFDDDELAYLAGTMGVPPPDLAALRALRFEGDVWAVPEGRVVFAGEPLLEVTAPLPQPQLVETALLNFVTFQTSVATKAARCVLAAPDADLVDFAARRTHGLEAADAVARACAIAGFAGTSNVAAARTWGLTAMGTMAHSYVQAFADESLAFRAFATDFPAGAVFLVDTFDTERGVRTAIQVAREFGLPGERLGVRLDSGDLGALAHLARRLLDQAGFLRARIMASGGLDEYDIARLVTERAPIDAFGVGTKVGVSADAPSLDSAYKLVDYAGRPVLKLSPGKATAPGAKQVYRAATADEPDLLCLREEATPGGREPMLVSVMRGGIRQGRPDSVADGRERLRNDLAWLPAGARWLRGPEPISVVHSPALRALTERLTRQAFTTARPAGSG